MVFVLTLPFICYLSGKMIVCNSGSIFFIANLQHFICKPFTVSFKKRLLLCFVGILVTTVALWAVVTHLRTCCLPPPHLPQSHLQLEDTKCLATPKMHKNLLCITEVAPCTPQLHRTVLVSHHASPHTPTL